MINKIALGEKLYKQILEEARSDSNILGLILTAGRGKGVVTERSDYDVYVIINNNQAEEYKRRYKKININEVFDLRIFSLTEFKNYAEFGSECEWDGYNFAHIKAQVDKGGIQKLINSKSVIPKNKISGIVEFNLGGYINLFYRSLKNFKDGNILASRLDSAESMPYLLNALFAMNGRIRPYNKYLEWELKNYPLKNTAWSNKVLISNIETILSSGDIKIQKKLFGVVKKLFYNNGFKKTIDSWNGYDLVCR